MIDSFWSKGGGGFLLSSYGLIDALPSALKLLLGGLVSFLSPVSEGDHAPGTHGWSDSSVCVFQLPFAAITVLQDLPQAGADVLLLPPSFRVGSVVSQATSSLQMGNWVKLLFCLQAFHSPLGLGRCADPACVC